MLLLDLWRARRAQRAGIPRTQRHGLPVAAALVAGCAALAVLPARWLMCLADDDAMVAIVDAEGTIWNGTALLALGPPGARRTLPQPLHWRWRWNGLVVHHPWLGADVRLAPSWRGLATPSFSLSAQTLRLPADLLAALGAPLNTLAPGGNLELRWPDYQGGIPRGPYWLQIDWRDASSALSTVHPLGSYRLQVAAGGVKNDGTASPRQLSLTTLAGPMQVQATGTWNGRKAVLSGTAEPAAGAPDNVREGLDALLSALGRRNGDKSIF